MSKRTAASKLAPVEDPSVEAEPVEMGDDPAPTTPHAPAPAPAAPVAPAAGGGGTPASHMASSIPVVVGTAGYYTGARRAETKAEYQARLGSAYGTFGDLGWILGTSPKT